MGKPSGSNTLENILGILKKGNIKSSYELISEIANVKNTSGIGPRNLIDVKYALEVMVRFTNFILKRFIKPITC